MKYFLTIVHAENNPDLKKKTAFQMLHRLHFGELLQSSAKESQSCKPPAAQITFRWCYFFLTTFLIF